MTVAAHVGMEHTPVPNPPHLHLKVLRWFWVPLTQSCSYHLQARQLLSVSRFATNKGHQTRSELRSIEGWPEEDEEEEKGENSDG